MNTLSLIITQRKSRHRTRTNKCPYFGFKGAYCEAMDLRVPDNTIYKLCTYEYTTCPEYREAKNAEIFFRRKRQTKRSI